MLSVVFFIVLLSVVKLSAATLTVVWYSSYAECHYDDYHNDKCRYAECRGTINFEGENGDTVTNRLKTKRKISTI